MIFIKFLERRVGSIINFNWDTFLESFSFFILLLFNLNLGVLKKLPKSIPNTSCERLISGISIPIGLSLKSDLPNFTPARRRNSITAARSRRYDGLRRSSFFFPLSLYIYWLLLNFKFQLLRCMLYVWISVYLTYIAEIVMWIEVLDRHLTVTRSR